MILILQGIAAFFAVFFRGIQQQNVIGGDYKHAFGVSYLIAGSDVIVISLIVDTGWISFLPIGTGAAFGIVTSMYVYRKYKKV